MLKRKKLKIETNIIDNINEKDEKNNFLDESYYFNLTPKYSEKDIQDNLMNSQVGNIQNLMNNKILNQNDESNFKREIKPIYKNNPKLTYLQKVNMTQKKYISSHNILKKSDSSNLNIPIKSHKLKKNSKNYLKQSLNFNTNKFETRSKSPFKRYIDSKKDKGSYIDQWNHKIKQYSMANRYARDHSSHKSYNDPHHDISSQMSHKSLISNKSSSKKPNIKPEVFTKRKCQKVLKKKIIKEMYYENLKQNNCKDDLNQPNNHHQRIFNKIKSKKHLN